MSIAHLLEDQALTGPGDQSRRTSDGRGAALAEDILQRSEGSLGQEDQGAWHTAGSCEGVGGTWTTLGVPRSLGEL